ncbi:PLD nuclease N-terminal domain-containing protein [Paenibacillus alkaliterrae]|uniref:PLD nuclease N-terminal domain-containing protein n=1 Tax=Paenibacillus alkaliterrae TaxID=320909 RepID=UPI001F3B9899|nr:PLD nuclease N-terminal domain-containing protein [Paenibacillus alkaliterrae]MCF2939070.1 PLD nuclease N-terminal domain-containing protein [Paenibacillus alkaliterrae]
MYDNFDFGQILPIIAPILTIQLVLVIIALVMCIKAEQTRGPKWMWVLIILFVNLIGPITFFIFGRRNER